MTEVNKVNIPVLDSFRACLAINTIQVCLSCQFKQMPLTCPLVSGVYLFEVITIDLLNKIGITSRNTPSRYIETNGGTSPDNDP